MKIALHPNIYSSQKYTAVQVCDATGEATRTVAGLLKKIFLCIVCFCAIVSVNAQHSVTLRFENFVGNKLLSTDSAYANTFNELFTVRNFQYYISNIELVSATGEKQRFTNAYFLVDNAIDSSKEILLNTYLNNIAAVHFLIGVDSLKNVSGVQAGVLDPARGMFWTWNSGYIMAKLDGNSPAAKMPAHAFSYHIGGYMLHEETARKIDLILPKNISATNAVVTIRADILKWFDGLHQIKIADNAFCHEPGKNAMMFADNYSTMFSLVQE